MLRLRGVAAWRHRGPRRTCGGGGATGHITKNLQRPRRQRPARRPLHACADQPRAASPSLETYDRAQPARKLSVRAAARRCRRQSADGPRCRSAASTSRCSRAVGGPLLLLGGGVGHLARVRVKPDDRPRRTSGCRPGTRRSPAEPGALRTLGHRARRLTGVGVRPGRAWTVARVSLDASMLVTAGSRDDLRLERGRRCPRRRCSGSPSSRVFVLGFCAARGMYGSRLRYELLEDLRVVLVATSLAAIAVLLLRGAHLGAARPLAAQVIRTWAFATAYLAAGRVALHWSRTKAYRHGESFRPTLIIGAGKVGRLTAKRLLVAPGARPQADRLPRQGPDGRRGRLAAASRARRELGPRPGRLPSTTSSR